MDQIKFTFVGSLNLRVYFLGERMIETVDDLLKECRPTIKYLYL